MSFQNINEKHLQLCLERDRVLCSPEFARSPVMTTLLKFLVDHKLNDSNTKLKAYTIAVDALGRSPDFDPQSDSYPRVQIGRLRKLLDAYYALEDRETRLNLPIGSYEIEIIGTIKTAKFDSSKNYANIDAEALVTNDLTVPKTGLRDGRWLLAGAMAAIILSALLGAYDISNVAEPTSPQYPSLVVYDAELSHKLRDADLANQTSNMISSALSRFEGINIYMARQGEYAPAEYGLKIKVAEGRKSTVTLLLLSNKDSKIIWSQTIKEDPASKQLNLALDKTLIQIAGPYGVISQDMREKLAGNTQPGYPCTVQFDHYLRYRDENQLRSTMECLDDTLRLYPNDAFLISRIAFADHIVTQRALRNNSGIEAAQLAHKAVQIDPGSANARFARARTEFFQNDCEAGRKWGDEALERNPLDTRIMGYFGLYLVACNDPYAEELVQRALDLDPDVDLIVPSSLAFLKFQRGDNQGAYEISKKFLTGALREEPSLMTIGAICAASVGRRKEAEKLWTKVTKHFGFPVNAKARPVLEKFIVNKQIVDKLERAIQATSLVPVKTDSSSL